MSLTEDEVTVLFRAIVGRDPTDRFAVRSLMRMDLTSAIGILMDADERQDEGGYWMRRPAAEDVDLLYRVLLERDVESNEVRSSAMQSASITGLMQAIVSSEEFRTKITSSEILQRSGKNVDRGMKYGLRSDNILLFGAYGNGNLGDRDQAFAIGQILLDHGADPSCLTACSWLDNADYDFQGLKLSSLSIVDPERLNTSALIIIGGGGLLGTPHYPLSRMEWVEALVESRTPYILWAIGGSSEHIHDPAFAQAYAKLVVNAAAVSARDDDTLTALRQLRADAFFAMDPVLYGAVESMETETFGSPARRVDMILRAPNTHEERAFVSKAAAIYAHSAREELGVIFVEPDLPEEREVMHRFPGYRVACTTKDLVEELHGARLGLSMRLHGLGAVMRRGIPVVGVAQPKIRSFLKLMNLEDQFFNGQFDELLQKCMDINYKFSMPKPDTQIVDLSRLGQSKLLEFVQT